MKSSQEQVNALPSKKLFPAFAYAFGSDRSIMDCQFVLVKKIVDWDKVLNIPDFSKLIQKKGKVISLFSETIKLHLTDTGIELKTTALKKYLYNDAFNAELIGFKFLNDFIFSEMAENNIIGLLRYGLIAHADRNSELEFDVFKVDNTAASQFLNIVLSETDERFNLAVANIADARIVDLLKNHRNKFSSITKKFRETLSLMLLEHYGIDQTNSTPEKKAQLAKLLPLVSDAEQIEFAKLYSVDNQLQPLIERLNKSKPFLLAPLMSAKNQLTQSDENYSWQKFFSSVMPTLEKAITEQDFNHSLFFKEISNFLPCFEWAKSDYENCIVNGHDILGDLIFNGQEITNTSLKFDELETVLIGALSVYLNNTDDMYAPLRAGQSKTIVDFIMNHALAASLFINILYSFTSKFQKYSLSLPLASACCKKIIYVLHRELSEKGNFNDIFSSNVLLVDSHTYRHILFSNSISDPNKLVIEYILNGNDVYSVATDLKRQITLMFLQQSANELEMSNRFEKLKDVICGDTAFKKVTEWETLLQFYSENPMDGIISNCLDMSFIRDFMDNFVTYSATVNGQPILIFFMLASTQSRMTNSFKFGNQVFMLHSISFGSQASNNSALADIIKLQNLISFG